MLQVDRLGNAEGLPEVQKGLQLMHCARREIIGVAAVLVCMAINTAVVRLPKVAILGDQHVTKSEVNGQDEPYVLDAHAMPPDVRAYVAHGRSIRIAAARLDMPNDLG